MEQTIHYFILLNIIGLPLVAFLKKEQYNSHLYFLPVVMGAIGLTGAVVKGIQAAKQAKLAGEINPDDPTYKTSQYAKDNLGLAQSLFNGRMAGAADLQRNIQGSQASAIGSIERNATNSSQALALASGTQGQTNAALQNLAVNEAQNKQALAGQVMSANRDLVNEGDKEYNDKLRKYQQDVQAKSALQQAKANNISGIFNDLASTGIIAANMGLGQGERPGTGFGNFQSAAPNQPLPNMYGASGINMGLLPQYSQGSLAPGMMNGATQTNYGPFANPLNWRR